MSVGHLTSTSVPQPLRGMVVNTWVVLDRTRQRGSISLKCLSLILLMVDFSIVTDIEFCEQVTFALGPENTNKNHTFLLKQSTVFMLL